MAALGTVQVHHSSYDLDANSLVYLIPQIKRLEGLIGLQVDEANGKTSECHI